MNVAACAAILAAPGPVSALAQEGAEAAGSAGEAAFSGSLIFALVGAVFVAYPVLRKRRREKIARFREITGTVVGHDTNKVDVSSSDDYAADWRYEPAPRYAYEVGGRSFECKAIGMDVQRLASPEKAHEFMREHYPIGSAVTVFYDPENPKDALLERPAARRGIGWAILHWGVVSIGVLLLAFGLLGLAGSLMA